MPPVAWFLILLLAGLWSTAFLFTEIVLSAVGPFTAAALRVGFGAVSLLLVAPLLGVRLPIDARTWGVLAVMGLLNNAVPFTLITLGQTGITSGMAAILNATTPVFTVIAAHLLTSDEKIGANKLAGIALGIAGVVALLGQDAAPGGGDSMVGQALVLAAACSYAAASLWGRRLRGLPAMTAASGQLVCSSLMIIPLAWSMEAPALSAVPAGTWAAAAAQGALATGLAYVVYFAALKRAGSTNLMLVTLLMPPGAVLLGWLLLDETLAVSDGLGLALILAGLLAIDGRLVAFLRPSSAPPREP